jgi:hypothetical protein
VLNQIPRNSFCNNSSTLQEVQVLDNRPIPVYRLGEMPIQSGGQGVSSPRGKAGVRLNAHTELRAEREGYTGIGLFNNATPPNAAQLLARTAHARTHTPMITNWRIDVLM